MRRLLAALALVLGAVMGAAGPAVAGGSPLYPVKDRYEPGDTVALVGYSGPLPVGWEARGPYRAFLLSSPATFPADRGVLVGNLSVTATGAQDWTAYRVSLRFTLPDGIPAGRYEVGFCGATPGCDGGLGDLTATPPFAVGVEPAAPSAIRTWPLSEPEIANLDPDVVVAGPGYQMTAAEARSRAAVSPAPAPIAQPAPTIVTGSVPVTAVAPPIGDLLVKLPRREAHPWALLSGGLIVCACVGTVLSALGRDAGGR